MANQKEIEDTIKLAEERADNLKDFKGSNYTKIKFDVELTDYQFNIMLKIIEFVKSFEVKIEQLEWYWNQYHLPLPIRPIRFSELLREIDQNSYFCIQDDKSKRHVDYFNHRHYSPSILLNEQIRSMNTAISEYRTKEQIDEECILKLSLILSQSIILINNNVLQFYLYNHTELDDDPTLEEVQRHYPNRRFFRDAQSLHFDVMSVLDLIRLKPETLPASAINVANAYLLMEKYKCMFSALCGLMLDAIVGTEKYFQPLKNIEMVLRLVFNGSELYRLELPSSPVDTSQAIGSRGSQAHTTIIKLFLIDQNENRIILRIDLPHVRAPKFHFNVESPDTKRYSGLSHMEIESNFHDDSLIPVLDILKMSIQEQMPDLCVVCDTNNKDEKVILQDMEKLIIYRHMCVNYIVDEDYSKQLKKVAGYLQMPSANIEKVLDEANKKFSV